MSALATSTGSQIDMPVHPVCEIFPIMDNDSLASLREDIRKHGLISSIVVHEGQIADGRNRLLACRELGIEPRFVEWRQVYGGPMPISRWIWSMNVERRHLTKEQIAFAITARRAIEEREAARERQLSALKQNAARNSAGTVLANSPGRINVLKTKNHAQTKPAGTTREILAREAGVSEHQIRRALKVQRANPELVKQVIEGKITAQDAEAKIKTDQPTKRQQMIENAAKERMMNALSHVRGACRGLPELDVAAIRNQSTAEEIKTWASIARESAKQLRAFASRLSEGRK